jgi:hypothetical protein
LETNFLNKFSSFSETEKIAFRKKALLFGFFLFVSIVLWLLIAFSKDYSDQINYPISYKNFPSSKVLIGDLPDHLVLSVKADGFTLLRFRLSSRYLPISFSVNSFKMNRLSGNDSSSFYIETRYARDHIASQLSPEFTISEISPDTLIFRFASVASKKVPVVPAFTFNLDKQLILKKQIELDPDSVVASGPDFIIDTLNAVFTNKTNLGLISKTDNEKVKIQKIKYVYVKEVEVNISYEIEKFTEKSIQLPVEVINLPDNLNMQAFPRYIQATCQVGLSNYEKLNPAMFRAHIDYLDIISKETTKLKVYMSKQPVFIQNLKYSPKTVEYIIEK